MSNEKNELAPVTPEAAAEAEVSTVVTFAKPYTFEGKVYTEIDLAGLDNLTAEDMIAADRHLTRNGNLSPTPELTIEYACYIASIASGQPIEFFKRLPPRDAIKLKGRITRFFYGEE